MCIHIPFGHGIAQRPNKFECHLANIGSFSMNCTTANSGGRTHQCIDTWNYEFNTIKLKVCESIHSHRCISICICILFIIFVSLVQTDSFVQCSLPVANHCHCHWLLLNLPQLMKFAERRTWQFSFGKSSDIQYVYVVVNFDSIFQWIYTQTDQFSWSIGRLVNSAFHANVNGTTGE